MTLTKRQLEYLCVIALLSPNNRAVRSADIAEKLGVSRVSVTSMTKTLTEDGFVSKERYGSLRLTPSGRAVAGCAVHLMRIVATRIPLMGFKLPRAKASMLPFAITCVLMGCDETCVFSPKDALKAVEEHMSPGDYTLIGIDQEPKF